ncbi:hypothetical protein ACWPKO_26695 (plasmid) [Coraliomargarita sp. W4R53]
MQKPEEPSEWAGLPSEPARATTDAEQLPHAASIDLGLGGLLGETPGAIESITIAIDPTLIQE